jgi:ABC-2 type transport system ATP-binding protein
VNNLIEAKELSKSYGGVRAVDQVSWTVPQGSITGLLGSNGAGKTTTLKLLMGMTQPSHGSARVGRYDIVADSIKVKHVAAFVPEDKNLYDRMPAKDFMRFYFSFFQEWDEEKARKLCEQWQLPWGKKLGAYSKGMRGRLLLAVAISRNPQVLLLDEPTDGMDPEGVEQALQQLTFWVGGGAKSVLISTHRLDEVERICDRVILMNQGRILIEGELDDLRASHKLILVIAPIPDIELNRWTELAGWNREGNVLRIRTHSSPEKVLERLRSYAPSYLEILDMNLREIYLDRVDSSGGAYANDVEELV